MKLWPWNMRIGEATPSQDSKQKTGGSAGKKGSWGFRKRKITSCKGMPTRVDADSKTLFGRGVG